MSEPNLTVLLIEIGRLHMECQERAAREAALMTRIQQLEAAEGGKDSSLTM